MQVQNRKLKWMECRLVQEKQPGKEHCIILVSGPVMISRPASAMKQEPCLASLPLQEPILQQERSMNVNDNTEYISRTTDYLATRFLNGTTVIARHYRTHRENWLDGFSRNDSLDAIALKQNPMPTDEIRLNDFKVNGHSVTFSGRLITAFNTDAGGQLISFEGHKCRELTLDGKTYTFSSEDQPAIAFTRATPEEKAAMNAIVKVFINGKGKISIPVPAGTTKIKGIYAGKGKKAGIPFILKEGMVTLDFSSETSGKWYFICI